MWIQEVKNRQKYTISARLCSVMFSDGHERYFLRLFANATEIKWQTNNKNIPVGIDLDRKDKVEIIWRKKLLKTLLRQIVKNHYF